MYVARGGDPFPVECSSSAVLRTLMYINGAGWLLDEGGASLGP